MTTDILTPTSHSSSMSFQMGFPHLATTVFVHLSLIWSPLIFRNTAEDVVKARNTQQV